MTGEEKRLISRETIAIVVVVINIYTMLCFLLSLWFLEYYVKADSDRHNKLLLETKQFALEFWRLPALTEDYTI